MTEYFLRLFLLLPVVGGLIWSCLWLWKRVHNGGLTNQRAETTLRLVEVLALGTSGKLAVIAFGTKTLLVATSRQGIALISESSAESGHT